MPLPGLGAGFAGVTSRAVADLGLGDMLQDEVLDETEELRKKRMQAQRNRGLMGAEGGALAPQMLYGSVTGGGLPGGY